MYKRPYVQLKNTLGEFVFHPSIYDTFGRQRVSEAYSLFDSKQVFDNQGLNFSENAVNGGVITYQAQKSSTLLTIDNTVGSRATRQTRPYFNYQPGKGQHSFITFTINGSEAGAEKRIGYFDDDNGAFLKIREDGVYFTQRSDTSGSPVDLDVEQANWSIDTLDGVGPSGFTLDLTKSQILFIDFEWLGVGSLIFGFVIDHQLIECHEFKHANIGPGVYMRTPNLPVRWEIERVGAVTGTPSLEAICCSVTSESGSNPLTGEQTTDNQISGKAITNVGLTPILAIRLKTSYTRAGLFPIRVSVGAATNSIFYWSLRLFQTPTVGDGSWVNKVNSIVQENLTATAAITGGINLVSGYASSADNIGQSNIGSLLGVAADYSGVRDELVLLAQKVGGGSDTAYGSLTYQEVK